MIATDQFGNETQVDLCTLCDSCGFIRGSQVGVLKEELGLEDIIENQIIFPCHKILVAFSGSEHGGTEKMVEETGKLKVCSGFVQSFILSGVKPKTGIMGALMSMVTEIDERVMTLDEMRKYHKIGE